MMLKYHTHTHTHTHTHNPNPNTNMLYISILSFTDFNFKMMGSLAQSNTNCDIQKMAKVAQGIWSDIHSNWSDTWPPKLLQDPRGLLAHPDPFPI